MNGHTFVFHHYRQYLMEVLLNVFIWIVTHESLAYIDFVFYSETESAENTDSL